MDDTIPNTDIPKTIFNDTTTVYDYLSSGDVVINNNNFYDSSLSYSRNGSTILTDEYPFISSSSTNNETKTTSLFSWDFSLNNIAITGKTKPYIKIIPMYLKGGFGVSYLKFPNIYEFVLAFSFHRCKGTISASQSISFPTEGTYTLSFCVSIRKPNGTSNKTSYDQKLSIIIGDNIIIDNWCVGIDTYTKFQEAQFITSKPFTVVDIVNSYNLTISSTIASTVTTNTEYSFICITGLSINKYVDG